MNIEKQERYLKEEGFECDEIFYNCTYRNLGSDFVEIWGKNSKDGKDIILNIHIVKMCTVDLEELDRIQFALTKAKNIVTAFNSVKKTFD